MFACLAIFTAGPISCLPENRQRKKIFFGTLDDAEPGKRLPVLRLEGMSTLHPCIPALGIGSSNCSSTGKRNYCLDKEGPKNLDNNSTVGLSGDATSGS
jgi:hypothetical protein